MIGSEIVSGLIDIKICAIFANFRLITIIPFEIFKSHARELFYLLRYSYECGFVE
jgi:hypothetical protein